MTFELKPFQRVQTKNGVSFIVVENNGELFLANTGMWLEANFDNPDPAWSIAKVYDVPANKSQALSIAARGDILWGNENPLVKRKRELETELAAINEQLEASGGG